MTRNKLPHRPRRNRSDEWTRRLVAENRLSVDDLILPVFVQDKDGVTDVPGMPGVKRYGLDRVEEVVVEALNLSIPAIALFPYSRENEKTEDCRAAYDPENTVCRAIRKIRSLVPRIGLIGDVALDPYNSNGHDGLYRDGIVLNDETLETLCKQAIVQVEAGCDFVGPSDMMDGRVGAIRSALDGEGFHHAKIMSYSAKYASGFYGPFREAVGTRGCLRGDKRTYQMNPANGDEALRLVESDLAQGADMVMVKPGLPYLDVIHRIKANFAVPTMAYHVSGEYAMIKAAAMQGWLDEEETMMESLLSFKRAGADGILTYFALDAAKSLLRQR